jgi:hypothetical protein
MPPRKLTPVQVLERLLTRLEKRMEALQRVKLDGFQMVIAELEVEQDYLRRAKRYLEEWAAQARFIGWSLDNADFDGTTRRWVRCIWRSHAITKLLSNPEVSDQMYTEIVGHVGNPMKRRYSKQRKENKRGARNWSVEDDRPAAQQGGRADGRSICA